MVGGFRLEVDVVALQRVIACALAAVLLAWPSAAMAGGHGDGHVTGNDPENVYDTDINLIPDGDDRTPPNSDIPAVETPPTPTHTEPVCEDHGGRSYNDGNSCSFIVRCTAADGTQGYLVQEFTDMDPPELVGTYCVTEQEIQEIEPTVTPGLVQEAFEQIPLPKSELVVQPPRGDAPVNFAVIYSTVADDQDQSVQLLGQRVYLKIWPSAYTWHTGDGSEDIVTDWPGRTYDRSLSDLDNYVWHKYLEAGVVQPAVDVTYSAEFSVGDQAHWEPVDGTVTVEGDPNPLTITPLNPVLSGN